MVRGEEVFPHSLLPTGGPEGEVPPSGVPGPEGNRRGGVGLHIGERAALVGAEHPGGREWIDRLNRLESDGLYTSIDTVLQKAKVLSGPVYMLIQPSLIHMTF